MSFSNWKLLHGRKLLFLPCLILAMATMALQPAPLSASPPVAIVKTPPSATIGIEHVAGEVLVKFRHRPLVSESAAIHARMGAELVSIIPAINVHRVRAVRGQTADDLIQAYASRPDVEYVEPNGIVHTMLTPNDPYFPQLYGLHNTGQTGGTQDADIDAPEAWDVQTGSSGVIVAGIDTGVDYNHQDLAMNMWTNTGEIPGNGVDDDGNGYIDDVRGWDFVNNDNDPMDDNGHGTHTAGTIAAVGNNGVGVAGVSWQAKIMPLKFLDATGEGTFEAAASAIVYSADMGARLSSNSWGCGLSPDCFSPVIEDAIAYANSRDVLFVVAAGNDNNNNDVTITYPCVSSQPNVICVAATDHNDQKASFSSYGLTTVDIGAPGVNIYSTVPTGSCYLCATSGYRFLDGTSMATPHVAGAAVLLLAQFPDLTPVEVRTILMGSSDPVSTLFGITVSGGRLNVNNALGTHFTVTSNPSTQGIVAGESANYTISVNSVNNFNAPVTLDLVSPDPTITGSFSVNPVTPPVNGSSSSTLAIYTTGATSRGTYILTVSGIDALGETRSFPITLVVGSPDFTVSINPSSQTIEPGDSRAYIVIISSIDGYNASVTLSMTVADLNISGSFSPNPMTLPGGGSVISTLTVTTTPSVPLGNYTLAIEGTDGTKSRTGTATLMVSNMMDLLMTAVSGPASSLIGGNVTISSTVQNKGTISSNSFQVSLYLSPNATITRYDVRLGGYAISLAGGASATVDTTVTLPNLVGTYYIGAIVDPWDFVTESNETNNALAGNTIVITSEVDLVMTEVTTTTTSVPAGGSFTVTDTIKNQGPMTTTFNYFCVGLYLSADTTITTSDTNVASRCVESLAAGASDSANTTVTVPTSIAPGTYYIGAIADFNGFQPESDETNNALAGNLVVITYIVDLVMTEVSTTSSSVEIGESLTIVNTVKNQGTTPALSYFYINLYLSSDATITTSDIWLGSRYISSLGPGASDSANTTVTVPTWVAPGTYYIGAIADQGEQQPESDETNNSLAGGTIVVIRDVDLVMTAVSTTSSSVGIGESLIVASTVKNQGTTTTSSGFNVSFYLSSDTTITTSDNLLGYRSINSLEPGVSDSANTTVTVNTYIAPGTYYIGAIVDPWNSITESDETNNAMPGGAIVVVLDVDLVMTEVSSVGSGENQSLTIANTVKNQGTTATSSSFYVGLYLSPDATITTSDTLLDSRGITRGSLGPGMSDSTNTTVTVAGIAPGTYYIGAIADFNGLQPERNETNNAMTGNTITIISDLDLLMTEVSTTSGSVRVGESLTIANTVKNQGATTTSSGFNVGFYLSPDATITTSDNWLGYRSINSLGPGMSDSANTTVTVPTWSGEVRPGTYYIGAIADIGQSSHWETDETNNALAGNTIVVTSGADLIMTSVSGPASAVYGSNVTISDTVKNQGTGSTGSSFNIGLYLSTDSVIAAGDTFLGSRSVSTLSAGGSNSGSTTVTIPTTVAPGTYYLGALSDNNNVVAESNEANNSLTGNIIQITAPDLLMTGVIPNGTSVRSGGTLSVTDTVQNSGSGSSGAFTIDYHLSFNVIYGDTDDVVITTTRSVSALTAGNSSTVTTDLTIPATTLNGQYYICAMADSGNTNSEGDETNNTLCSSAQVFVTAEVRIDQATSGDQRFPWTDYNETTGEYLVLWQDKRNGSNDDIYGVRLDQNGNRIGSDFAVSTASGHQQRVLVKSGGGGYLALWHDLRNYSTNGADIYGAWIDGSGTVGPEMVICACAQHQWNPVAGYDPVSNTFLVVFLSGTGSGTGNDIYDLWGAVIPAGGTMSVTPFTMVTLSGAQRGPQIGYDYGNNQYYMAWNDRRGANYDIYGSRVSTSGTLLDGTGILLSGATGNQFRPTVTDRRPTAGVNNHLIAWTDYRPGTQADVYGIYVDGNGAAVGSEFVISTNTADQANVVADVDWINTKELVGWIDRRNGTDYDIYIATVDQAGVVAGETAIAGQPTVASDEQRAGVVTYTTDGVNDYGFLTVWMDRRNGTDYDIYGIKVWL